MGENIQEFMELFGYVDYIWEERVKIQSFLGGLVSSYQDWIEFVDPKILEATVQMGTHCYNKNKGKEEIHSTWKEKSKGYFELRRMEFQQAYAPNYWERDWPSP